MNTIVLPFLAFVAGLFLGTFFFGGLWFTVRKGVASKNPALLFLGSFVLRMSVTLAGFYFAGGGNLVRFATCLAGFLVARLVVTQLTKKTINISAHEAQS